MGNSAQIGTEKEVTLKHRSIWVLSVESPLSPEYNEDVYCDSLDAVNFILKGHCGSSVADFVFDDLSNTYVPQRPIKGFVLRINKRLLWRLE